jgi:hypothetical protein
VNAVDNLSVFYDSSSPIQTVELLVKEKLLSSDALELPIESLSDGHGKRPTPPAKKIQ